MKVYSRPYSRLRLISVHLPEAHVEAIDELVRLGFYTSRSEAIRMAVRDLIQKYWYVSKVMRRERGG